MDKIMNTINEIEDKSTNILNKLHKQKEQLQNDNIKLEIIDEKVSYSNKILNNIKKLLKL
jgi:hypothetical protein